MSKKGHLPFPKQPTEVPPSSLSPKKYTANTFPVINSQETINEIIIPNSTPIQSNIDTVVESRVKSRLVRNHQGSNNSLDFFLPIDENNITNEGFVVGLENLGNTCFINSSLQCLLHIKPFINYFMHTITRNDVKDDTNPKKGKLATSFTNLVREISLKKNKGLYVSPIKFIQVVSKFAPHLLDHQQQDCQEFLRFLLDAIAEDLCKTSQLKPVNTDLWSSYNNSEIDSSATDPSNNYDSINNSNNSNNSNLNNNSLPAVKLPDDNNKNNDTKSKKGNLRFLSNSLAFSHNNNDVTQVSMEENISNNMKILNINNSNTNDNTEINVIKSLQELSEDAWENYLKLNKSIVTDIFAGQLQSTVTCTVCSHNSFTFDPFLDLSIPIVRNNNTSSPSKSGGIYFPSIAGSRNDNNENSNKCSLKECLDKFLSEEILDGDEMFTCEKCKIKQKCTKKLSIYKYPKVLVIQMKRFRYNSISRDKVNTNVDFPFDSLDMFPYISNDTQKKLNNNHPMYDLCGFSNHIGSLHGGHYVAHINVFDESNKSRWLCFNDASITNVKDIKSITSSAYVLFYILRE
jgi:ubiquitin C-terminal hydrolase